jgi:hypothetical protein
LCQVIQSHLGEISYSCVKPMAHTNHTTTNQIKQPVATSVRSMEASSAAVLKANARMRKVRMTEVGCFAELGGVRSFAGETRMALVEVSKQTWTCNRAN